MTRARRCAPPNWRQYSLRPVYHARTGGCTLVFCRVESARSPILHRSHRNRTTDRFRRSFVGHYANARSFTRWGYGESDPAGTNRLHILARGDTHLPHGQPRFGTPCAANVPALRGAGAGGGAAMMANMADGEMMSTAPMDMARNDPDAHDD